MFAMLEASWAIIPDYQTSLTKSASAVAEACAQLAAGRPA